jgi:hypothetical protein
MNASGTRRGHASRWLETFMFGAQSMRVDVSRPSRMLHVLARYVIALALILNGVSLPMGAAASGHGNGPVASTSSQAMPCHGVAEHTHASDPTDVSREDSHQSGAKSGVPCCANGHCTCGCIGQSFLTEFAYVWMALPVYPGSIDLNASYVPSGRFAVSLRPPIA